MPELSETDVGGEMGSDSALASPDVIGLKQGNLVINFLRKERLAGGSRMVRKCICVMYPDGSFEMHASDALPNSQPVGKRATRSARRGKAVPRIYWPRIRG